MGSSNSRPKICRVKPSQNWFEEQPFSETTSNRMTTAVQNTTEDHHEILRRQPFNQLPSLKQQVPHIVDSRPGLFNLFHKEFISYIGASLAFINKLYTIQLNEHVQDIRSNNSNSFHLLTILWCISRSF